MIGYFICRTYKKKIKRLTRSHFSLNLHIAGTNNSYYVVLLITLTSYLPPEQARDSGVSFVLSDWASISARCSSRISTTSTWPAVAARIRGVKPANKTFQKRINNST